VWIRARAGEIKQVPPEDRSIDVICHPGDEWWHQRRPGTGRAICFLSSTSDGQIISVRRGFFNQPGTGAPCLLLYGESTSVLVLGISTISPGLTRPSCTDLHQDVCIVRRSHRSLEGRFVQQGNYLIGDFVSQQTSVDLELFLALFTR
jgi:hypothetical protein